MLLILLTMAVCGGIGAGVGTLVTDDDATPRDDARRLDRNRFLGGFAGLGAGFLGSWLVVWRRAGATADSGFFVGD